MKIRFLRFLRLLGHAVEQQDHLRRDVAGDADPRAGGGAVAADADVAARHVHVRRAALAAEAAARGLSAGYQLLRGLVEFAEKEHVGWRSGRRSGGHETEAGHEEGVSVPKRYVRGGLLAGKELGEARGSRSKTCGVGQHVEHVRGGVHRQKRCGLALLVQLAVALCIAVCGLA